MSQKIMPPQPGDVSGLKPEVPSYYNLGHACEVPVPEGMHPTDEAILQAKAVLEAWYEVATYYLPRKTVREILEAQYLPL